MNFFAQELRKIAENCDSLYQVKFIGRECVGRLTDDMIVKMSFEKNSPDLGCYDKLKIRLINRYEGEIDTQIIPFMALWGKVFASDSDMLIRPHIWEDNGRPHWCGFTPTEQQYSQLYESVEHYLEYFTEPEQEETESMNLS